MNDTNYQRGTGHILAEGHDPKSCTACAYAAGRHDAQDSINKAQESLEHVERLLRIMLENESLSSSDYFSLEGPIRFTRTNILAR